MTTTKKKIKKNGLKRAIDELHIGNNELKTYGKNRKAVNKKLLLKTIRGGGNTWPNNFPAFNKKKEKGNTLTLASAKRGISKQSKLQNTKEIVQSGRANET